MHVFAGPDGRPMSAQATKKSKGDILILFDIFCSLSDLGVQYQQYNTNCLSCKMLVQAVQLPVKTC